jgi:hypothetical protein
VREEANISLIESLHAGIPSLLYLICAPPPPIYVRRVYSALGILGLQRVFALAMDPHGESW